MKKKTVFAFAGGLTLIAAGLLLAFAFGPTMQVPAEQWAALISGVIIFIPGALLVVWSFKRESAFTTICSFIVGAGLMGVGFWFYSWIGPQDVFFGKYIMLPVMSALAGLLGMWAINRSLYTEPERNNLEGSFEDLVIIVLGVAIMVCMYMTPWSVLAYFFTARSAMNLVHEIFP
ncbi:MAG: hypothetical protein Q8R29_03770 [bacterium]|nr:hypothetical protein [bacterium]